MPLTATVSWPTFPAGVPVTLARLRRAPGITLAGSVSAGDLASGAVTPAKVTPGAFWYAAASAFTSNVYLVALSPAVTAYATGLVVAFRANTENTDTQPSLNVSGLGAKVIYKHHEQPLVAGDIRNNQIVCVRYDSALNSSAGGWQMMSPVANPPTKYVVSDVGTYSVNRQVLNFGGATGYNTYKTLGSLAGVPIWFKAGGSNTGTATLIVDSLAETAIKKRGTVALQAGDIVSGECYGVIYDGTNFQLLNPSSRQIAQAWVKFNGTATSKTVTNARPAADQLTVTGHGITAATDLTGVQAVSIRQTGGAIHAGLAINTIYYAYVMDANTLKLSTTRQGGLDGTTSMVSITGDGTGTNTMAYITLNATYGVSGVVQRSSGGSLLTGIYDVYWEQPFGSAHYVVQACVKSGTANATLIMGVDQGDGGSASVKRFLCESENTGTNADPDEAYVLAHGVQ